MKDRTARQSESKLTVDVSSRAILALPNIALVRFTDVFKFCQPHVFDSKKHVDQIADGVDAGLPVRPLGGGSDAAGFQMQREWMQHSAADNARFWSLKFAML